MLEEVTRLIYLELTFPIPSPSSLHPHVGGNDLVVHCSDIFLDQMVLQLPPS